MKKTLLTIALSAGFALWTLAQDVIHPKNLRCEYMIDPQGIDVTEPRLFWLSESKTNYQKQTAYQVWVASSEANLAAGKADLWDSGKLPSDQSVQVKYAGKALTSDSKAFWKVKVWDKDGKESEWSPVATWSMGLLSPSDWSAKWIGLDRAVGAERPNAILPIIGARMVRKESEIKKAVKSATLYVGAAGLYEFYINGSRVGDAVLAPALSQTEKRMFYNTYDVTKLLKTGKNAFGSYLGAGRWTSLRPLQEATGEWQFKDRKMTDTLPGYKARFAKLIAQVNIVYTDGSKETIATDNSWKITTEGPITRNSEYDGESYDATKEMAGWNNAGFNDNSWMKAELVAVPTPLLTAENKEPIKVMETIKPIAVKEIKTGTFIYDMGQNMVGWAKLKVKGPKGAIVKMVFAELLKPDGSLYLDNIRTAQVTDYYVLKGDANGEEWQPRFTYHGFRYVEVTGFPGTPDLNTIEGKVVHDAVETVGTFECSNEIMTKLHKNSYWGIRGNYRSMPTDCPQRDERFGWLGDRTLEAKGESFIFRNVTLHGKWMQDINDAQSPEGSVPDVAPTHSGMIKIYNDGVVWPSCFIIVPDVLYQQTGDKEVIKKNYDAMVKWAKYMITFEVNDLMGKNTYGDWCMPPERMDLIWSLDPKRITSGVLLSSCYLYYDFTLISKYATMLGKPADAEFFKKEAEKLKKAINAVLFDNVDFVYDNNTLSSSIIPLGMGVVPVEARERVFQNTIRKLSSELQNKMGTGLIGGQWQMKGLADNGRPDLAYILATNRDYPSWGYQIEHGATTIWELWNGDKARPDMNSGNHVMLLGDVITWMYENVGGIAADPSTPGFKKIIMKPDLTDKLTFVKASHKSLYGTISSEWKLNGSNFNWTVEIPVNTTAWVYVPAANANSVTVDGKAYGETAGAKFVKMDAGKAVFEVGSGKYSFASNTFMMPVYQQFVFNPTITPSDTSSAGSQLITIKSNYEGSKTYYTIDGSDPSESSTLYTAPFVVKKYSIIKAKAFKQGLMPSAAPAAVIDVYDAKLNGWAYKYYEGSWKMLPDFSKEKVVSSGIVNYLNLKQMAKKEDYWGVVFNSNILIETQAEYNFYITSDDGSRLRIDGKQIAIMDGTHGDQTDLGKVSLTKGYHKIELEFFENVGGQTMDLQWQIPGHPKTMIPSSKLFLTVPASAPAPKK
jgi:alpha-L-rhamnosidase